MADRPFSRGSRMFTLAVLLALGVCVLSAGAGSAARTDAPALVVNYIGTASLQLQTQSGANVPSGGSVAAGTYQVQVEDTDYQNPKFTISGPGVNITDDLNSTGMGVDHPAYLGPYTFQANASYTVRDANLNISLTFNTVAGSSSSSGGSSSSSGGSTSTSSTGSGSTSSSTKSNGSSSSSSATLALSASVSAAGKPTVSFGGKAVKSLKAGIYKLTIADHSKKARLIIEKVGYHAMLYSTATAVGTTSHRLTLSPGKWFFQAMVSGPKTYFTVK